ncbi:MAG: peptidase dimerization domain-containing protein [Candidatus Moduliflexus flocculans]|nr:peptidase dimerization domain-containing protein [Candidatus Moduliflexus flocculans]
MSANVDGFDLEIQSDGCHGADPDLCVDPIVVGAEIVTALQVMVAREFSVHNNTVITVGSFHAGSAPNIIPSSARLEATVRNYGDDQRQVLQDKITRLVTEHLRGGRGDCSTSPIHFGTTSGLQRPGPRRRAPWPTAERVLGSKAALVEQKPEMGGEDFSYFGTIAPAVDVQPGRRPPGARSDGRPLPTFVADEAAIPIGVDLMANIITRPPGEGGQAGGEEVPESPSDREFAIMPG